MGLQKRKYSRFLPKTGIFAVLVLQVAKLILRQLAPKPLLKPHANPFRRHSHLNGFKDVVNLDVLVLLGTCHLASVFLSGEKQSKSWKAALGVVNLWTGEQIRNLGEMNNKSGV